MFTKHDITRDEYMLTGPFRKQGYDWWWHSLTAISEKTGEERAFFIEFFLCNPALREEEPVLGQKEENRAEGKKPSYLMVKVGWWGEDHLQLHRFFAWKDVKIHKSAPYVIKAGDCLASETRLKGSVTVSAETEHRHPEYLSDEGEMTWDLTIDKQIPFNVGYGAGKLFRSLKAFQMYWHAEGMKSQYKGVIMADGEAFRVVPEKSFGYADKNWGNDFTSPWVWLASSDLVSNVSGKRLENSVFDIGGGCPKAFGISLPRQLLSAFCYEGKPYEFNFSKFWTGTKTSFTFKEDASAGGREAAEEAGLDPESEEVVSWYVRQENLWAVMETRIYCRKKDMLFVRYEAPNGKMLHRRLWNGGCGFGNVKLYRKSLKGPVLIDDLKVGHVGCEYGEYVQ